MAQEDLTALLTWIQAAARARDAAASEAWDALITLVLRQGAPVRAVEVAPRLLAELIEELSSRDPQFAHAFQEWTSQYGTVAGSGEVRSEISGSNESVSGPVFQGNVHGSIITFGDEMAARPPGPPFGDDDWGDETDDNA
ncbi:hypothetical protein [Streptomyces milbemycinicus]|uniref:hypothetical protein n=1 Tax=Streptomyces milbemycinicus TaxID=476552 RepID=UPI0034042D49